MALRKAERFFPETRNLSVGISTTDCINSKDMHCVLYERGCILVRTIGFPENYVQAYKGKATVGERDVQRREVSKPESPPPGVTQQIPSGNNS